MSKLPRLLTPKTTYTIDYPEAIEFAKKQSEIFWLPDEISVEKDVQDVLVNLTPAEKHGVITVLKLFTLYEIQAGTEYWGGRVMRRFPRPDIQRMAATFSFFELGVHAPFYNKINEALHLNNDEFYSDYVNDPVLKERMTFIEEFVDSEDDALSLAVFSMIEGAVLYSSFAFLKHFQSQGKNKLMNIVAGINFSVRDENLHAEAGAWMFRKLLEEGATIDSDRIIEAARTVREHEHRIIDKIFEKGEIPGVTSVQLKHFVDSRINLCLKNLGFSSIYEVTYNPVGDWFYRGINTINFHDFFTKVGNSYNRNWSEQKLGWKVKEKA